MSRLRATAAEGVGGDGGDERRVDATGQADDDVGEPVLDHVIAGTERERFVDLANGRELGFDPRLLAPLAEVRITDLDL